MNKHYIVVSPEMSETIPILDDGSGPEEYFHCCVSVEAKNKRDAKIKAIKFPNEEMKDWIKWQRRDNKNPFSGLKVFETDKCKHGTCLCSLCLNEDGLPDCTICFN